MSPYEGLKTKAQVLEEISSFLAKCYFAYLCTVDEENRPHITPIFFVYDENTSVTYFMSGSKSTKIRNIRLNSRVSLAADIREPINPFDNLGAMIEGQATIERELGLEESPLDRTFTVPALRVFELFKRKYGIVSEVEPSFSRSTSLMRRFSDVLVSVRPKKIVYWQGGGRFWRVEF